ncbi:fibrous sheath-interacting protein 2-like isoform X8 [Aotus nancymaae]|uniref:fibrous sheath-interacting protein 2-like isoform X8 n=1 Tax=Aotus nancymaae TaxID=37293 RepID=UPI0030FDFC32
MEHKQQCECKDKQHVLKKKGADLQKIQATSVKRNKTGKKTLKHEGKRTRCRIPFKKKEDEDCYSESSAEILEESSQEQKPENRSSVEFIIIFERSKDVDNANSSNISETPKPNVSKRGCKMLTKMSSALSKVFSRNNTNISRSSSPTHHHED